LKKVLNSDVSPRCPHNIVNIDPPAAEIWWRVWGTPANFNGFRVWQLLHGTLVVGVSQTLRRWTEGATYLWQGGHHVGHWPTFLVIIIFEPASDTFALCVHCSNQCNQFNGCRWLERC